jgi:transcriptional regulator with XRE-family HTH domain
MKDLKTCRTECGLSQETLAERAEITATTINNIEQQNTSPQNDVRRRIEIVLHSRIDWLLTTGLTDVKETIWEQAEQEYRKTLLNINGLRPEEKEDFLIMARQYLDSLEALLETDDEDEVILFPIEINALSRRKNINLKIGDQ